MCVYGESRAACVCLLVLATAPLCLCTPLRLHLVNSEGYKTCVGAQYADSRTARSLSPCSIPHLTGPDLAMRHQHPETCGSKIPALYTATPLSLLPRSQPSHPGIVIASVRLRDAQPRPFSDPTNAALRNGSQAPVRPPEPVRSSGRGRGR